MPELHVFPKAAYHSPERRKANGHATFTVTGIAACAIAKPKWVSRHPAISVPTRIEALPAAYSRKSARAALPVDVHSTKWPFTAHYVSLESSMLREISSEPVIQRRAEPGRLWSSWLIRYAALVPCSIAPSTKLFHASAQSYSASLGVSLMRAKKLHARNSRRTQTRRCRAAFGAPCGSACSSLAGACSSDLRQTRR